ncbi:peptidylprolyl isomerase [Aquabacterium sp. A7-Y]|uniref:peptidylprolyl isomerase n=1 Tax=Aquabacterium sp. A7-Y TaxID=1349605 RepID=UPI00223E673C|nr:peptidylprolyl isomerase [Aquabacterium sp. A7-Y]MCW7540127.1 peptidylprolyl isomerase [Aquabacterium sp. A7-Y]
MLKDLLIAAALMAPLQPVQAEPLQKDERDVLRSARVYHIMKTTVEPLEKLRSRLSSLPPHRLLAEFKRIAQSETADPGSRSTGGDLGVITQGTMDEKFDTAVFAQQPMQVSPPQPSQFGWHLILVTSFSEEPVRSICERTLKAVHRAVPIQPAALYALSLQPAHLKTLHPRILAYMGPGWGLPMNWQGNLTYSRVDSDPSGSSMPRVVLHSELSFARYRSPQNGCGRSERLMFHVNCASSTVALTSHVEYEGRAASGRHLIEVVVDPADADFQRASTGSLAQIAELACKAPKQMTAELSVRR